MRKRRIDVLIILLPYGTRGAVVHMSHQDWDPVIFHKTKSASGKATAEEMARGAFETIERKTTNPKIFKLDNATESVEHKTVSTKLANAIVAARVAKKWSRQDLATKINEKVHVLDKYETRKAIPDPRVLCKMSRVLGVSLNKNM